MLLSAGKLQVCWVHAAPLSWREPLGDRQIKSPAHGSILLSDWLLRCQPPVDQYCIRHVKGCVGGGFFYFLFFYGSVIFFLLAREFCWFIHSSLMPRTLLHSLLSMSTQYQGEMSHAASSVCVSVHAGSVCFPLLPERAGMRASGGWGVHQSKRSDRMETQSSLYLTDVTQVEYS